MRAGGPRRASGHDDADGHDIDEAVNDGLRDVGQTLLVDRALVWRETAKELAP